MLLVINSINNDGKGSEDDIVKLVDPRIVYGGTGKLIVKAVPKLRQH
jgi:hypothetical protein